MNIKEFTGFIVGIVFSLFIYWISGGNFERSLNLGVTVCIGVVLGFVLSICISISSLLEQQIGGAK